MLARERDVVRKKVGRVSQVSNLKFQTNFKRSFYCMFFTQIKVKWFYAHVTYAFNRSIEQARASNER